MSQSIDDNINERVDYIGQWNIAGFWHDVTVPSGNITSAIDQLKRAIEYRKSHLSEKDLNLLPIQETRIIKRTTTYEVY